MSTVPSDPEFADSSTLGVPRHSESSFAEAHTVPQQKRLKSRVVIALAVGVTVLCASVVIFLSTTASSPSSDLTRSSGAIPALAVEESRRGLESAEPCTSGVCVETADRIRGILNPDVSPCDDAYTAFCGTWLESATLPEDMSSVDTSFMKIHIETRDSIREMIESWHCPSPQDISADPVEGWRQLAGCLYSQCMDEEGLDQKASEPLLTLLSSEALDFVRTDGKASEEQLSWTEEDTPVQLARQSARLHLAGIGHYVALFSHQHPTQKEQGNVVYFVHTGLGLSYDLYKAEDDTSARMRDSYISHIAELFSILKAAQGHSSQPSETGEFERRAKRVFAFEQRLQSISLTPAQNRDALLTTNRLSLDEFSALVAPTIHLPTLLEELEAGGIFLATERARSMLQGGADVVVDNLNFFSKLRSEVLFPPSLSAEEAFAALNDYVLLRTIRRALPALGGPWRAASERYSQVMSGATAGARWKTCLARVRGSLPWVVAEAFVTSSGREEASRRAEFARSILDDVREVFRAGVRDLPWIDAATAERALEKETKITASLGAPDWLLQPDAFVEYLHKFYGPAGSAARALREMGVSSEEAWERGALLLPLDVYLGRVGLRHAWSDLGERSDRAVWAMTPDQVNAYYMPSTNEIVFPDSIFRPPFLNPPAADAGPREQLVQLATSFGAFGAVVGHELTHAFDDQGSTMDGDGQMVDWWTPAAREGFKAAAECVVEQYGAFSIPELEPQTAASSAGAAAKLRGAGHTPPSWAVPSGARRAFGGESDGGDDVPHLGEVPSALELKRTLHRALLLGDDGHDHHGGEEAAASNACAEGAGSAAMSLESASVKVNGALTLGENIADAGGLRLALEALKLRIARSPELSRAAAAEDAAGLAAGAALLPGLSLTVPQLAVTSFSQIWCTKSRPSTARSRAASDPHAPGSSRVVGSLLNLPSFGSLFSCESDTPRVANGNILPLSEEPRSCQVW